MVDGNEPQIVEIDDFKGITVDPNDTIFDENDNAIQSFDREKNVTYKLKGSVNPLELTTEEKEKPESDTEQEADADSGNEKPEDTAKDNKTKKEEEVKYANRAEYILKKTGYDKDEIDFGGDVGKVKISDLSSEQQVEIISQEFDQVIADYEEHIAELEKREPELKFENPAAQQIVNYLKEGGDITKLAKEILSKDPVAQSRILSDSEVVKMSIRKEFPTYSDEDVEEEFKEMSDSGVARRAKAARTRMESEGPDLSSLSEEQKRERDTRVATEKAEFDSDVDNIRTIASGIKEIDGIPVSKEVMNFLIKKVTPSDMNSDSDFIKELSGNPKAIIDYAFWKAYGKQINDRTAQYYYEKGLKDSNIEKDKLSDEPVRSYQFNGAKKKKSPQSIDEVGFEKFLNADF